MRFSASFIFKYIIARSPEEMVEYYTNKVALNPDKFYNITSNFNPDTLESYLNSSDKTRFLSILHEIVKKVIDGLNQNNLLKYTEFVLFRATDKMLPADLDNIITYLKVFEDVKKLPRQDIKKDIQSFNSFMELQNYLEPFKGKIEQEMLQIKIEETG